MNMEAWLDRHPTVGVLSTEIVDETTKNLHKDEYRTPLEAWESDLTVVIWRMAESGRSCRHLRKYIQSVANRAVKSVTVRPVTSDLGYSRAIQVRYKYRERYTRNQVFHIPS